MSVDRAWREFTTGNPETVIALRRGGDQLARPQRRRGAGQQGLPQRRRAAASPPPGARRCRLRRRRAVRRRLLGHRRRERQRRRRPRGPDRALLRRPRRRRQRVPRRHLGLGLLRRPERPGHRRLRLRAREQPDGAGRRRRPTTDGREAGVCPDAACCRSRRAAEALDRTDDLAEAWLYAVDAGRLGDRVGDRRPRLLHVHAPHRRVRCPRRAWWSWPRRTTSTPPTTRAACSIPHVLPGNGMVANRLNFGPASSTTTTYRERSSDHLVGRAQRVHGGDQQRHDLGLDPDARRRGRAGDRLRARGGEGGPDPARAQRSGGGAGDEGHRVGRERPVAGLAQQGGLGPPVRLRSARTYTRRCRRSPRGTCRRLRSSTRRIGSSWRILSARPACAWRAGSTPRARAATRGSSRLGSGASRPTPNSPRSRAAPANAPREGELGQLDLQRIASQASRARFSLSERKELESTERYTVTLRLRVTDAQGAYGGGPARVLRPPRRFAAARIPEADRPRWRRSSGACRHDRVGAPGHRLRRHRRPRARDRSDRRSRAPGLSRENRSHAGAARSRGCGARQRADRDQRRGG